MPLTTHPAITALSYYLPGKRLTNHDICRSFPEQTPEKILAKTGIECRRVADDNEWASDLATAAGAGLLAACGYSPNDVDFLLLVTQSPDYLLPTTACLVHQRLGLPSTAGAMDINLGCSGFVYGLATAQALVATGTARRVCLLTCETYSKFTSPANFGVKAIFGDGATATMIEAGSASPHDDVEWLGPFVFGTDGAGAQNLILRRGGVKSLAAGREPLPADDAPNADPNDLIYMNGPEIFTFTLRVVPECVARLLAKARLSLEEIDLFVFHQANAFMLEHLRKKLDIPKDKFLLDVRDCGNTTSSTIPLALQRYAAEREIPPGARILLLGFGVGYSWAGGIMRWHPLHPTR